MNIDRNEECGFCGMPRHAHWGGPQALAAGRCAGFRSTAETKLRAAAPEMLAALKFAEPYIAEWIDMFDPSDEAAPDVKAARDECRDGLVALRAAIAKAEGRDDG